MKHVSSFKDRHGVTRWRFRKDGASFYICAPDSPDFADEYAACLVSAKKMADLHRARPDVPLVTQARNYLSRQQLGGSGFVYFVYGNTGRVKIGFTTDPIKRFGSLRTNCPDKLTLLGLVPGTKEDERAWHERFHGQRIFGEWYRSTSELKRQIRAIKSRTLSNHGVAQIV